MDKERQKQAVQTNHLDQANLPVSDARRKGRYLRLKFRGCSLDRIEFRFDSIMPSSYFQRGDEMRPLNWPDVEPAISLCFLGYIDWMLNKKSEPFRFGADQADMRLAKQLSGAIYQTNHDIHNLFYGENPKAKDCEPFVTHLVFPKVGGISKSGKSKTKELMIPVSERFLPSDCVEVFWDRESSGSSGQISKREDIQKLENQIRASLGLALRKPLISDSIPDADERIATAYQELNDRLPFAKSVVENIIRRNFIKQIDAPLDDFEGRKKEQDEIKSGLLKLNAVSIGMIHGMPGAGKTELALLVAKDLQSEFPDARLLVRLRGDDGVADTPREAMTKTLRLLQGYALELPADITSLRRIYVSALAGTKSLVLVDNAVETSEVELFIPPEGCAMIVTSRERIALHRDVAASVYLGEFQPGEAKKMLLRLCSSIKHPVAEQICNYCGYLPLAIRAAGNLLSMSSDLDPSEYAGMLENEHHRLETIGSTGVPIGVAASFNLSYARLSHPARKVFQSLSVFPSSFDGAAEAAICADSENEHLRMLTRFALVKYQINSKRYLLHDLMRVFAADLLRQSGSLDSATGRHAKYFASVFKRTEDLFDGNKDDLKAGSKLFVQEEVNILTGWRWSITHCGFNSTAAEICCHFAESGAQLSSNVLHPNVRLELYSASVDAARMTRQRKIEAIALMNLALAHYDTGKNLRLSTQLLEKSLFVAKSVNDVEQQSAVLAYLGRNLIREGDRKGALRDHLQATQFAKRSNDQLSKMQAIYHLGSAYIDIGKPVQSICCYHASLKIARRLGKLQYEVMTLGGLGRAYHKMGNKSKAIEFFENCLEQAEEIEDFKIVNMAALGLGRVFLRSDPAKALKYYSRSLELNRKQGNRKREGGALFDIGLAYTELKNQPDALKAFYAALKIAREVSHELGEGKSLEQLAEVFGNRFPLRSVILAEGATALFNETEPYRIKKLASKIRQWRADYDSRRRRNH